MSRSRFVAASVLVLFLALPALAGPGALEISETCAVHTGCFAGDTAGYPVTITPSAPASSFVLTSDLAIPDANTDGIEITKSAVHVDLNGFTVRGPVTCSGDPNVCTGTGTGVGIDGFNADRTTVVNGAVVGAGQLCVHLRDASRVENVQVSECGWLGVSIIGGGGVIESSTALRTAHYGLSAPHVSNSSASFSTLNGINGAGSGSSVVNCVATNNAQDGISVGAGGTVENSATAENGRYGIFALAGAIVRGSTAYDNDDSGIYTSSPNGGSLIVGNVVWRNGDGETTDHGIRCAGAHCALYDNVARENDGFGLFMGDATSAYRGNVTGINAAGTVSGGTDQGGNLLN